MPADIFLLFRMAPQEAGADAVAAPLRHSLAELLHAPGVLAARPFVVNVVLGDRPPAFYPELVMCELDDAHDAEATMAALGHRPGVRSVAWEASSVGVRDDFELPDHVYLQFSAAPPSMSFEEYSAWYQVHQDENIAQSDVLRRGWRYRLAPVSAAVEPGPQHLAAYEMKGALETLTADLASAMESGVISLPNWFTRFASLEAIATGERVAR
jgi:hypothetical protein